MSDQFLIRDISTYTTNWILNARVVEKSPINHLKNNNKIFYIDIVDKLGDTIRAKFWGEAAFKYFPYIELGKVYSFSQGRVSISNRKFNTNPNTYELTFDLNSPISLIEDDGVIYTKKRFNFISIRDIKNSTSDIPFVCDILCIVRLVSEPVTLNVKSGDETQRRSITVVDDSGYEMEVTFWSTKVNDEIFNNCVDKAVVLYQIKIKDWQGVRSGHSTAATTITYADDENIDKSQIESIKNWYSDAVNRNVEFVSMKSPFQATSTTVQRKDLSSISMNTEGMYEFVGFLKRIYWRNRDGELTFIYPSCNKCKKKVHVDENEKYVCPSCDTVVEPEFRYRFTAVFADYSGQLSIQFFDTAQAIINEPADKFKSMDQDAIKQILEYDILYQIFKVSVYAKLSTFNGDMRTVYRAVRAKPINYAEEIAYMQSVLNGSTTKTTAAKQRKVED